MVSSGTLLRDEPKECLRASTDPGKFAVMKSFYGISPDEVPVGASPVQNSLVRSPIQLRHLNNKSDQKCSAKLNSHQQEYHVRVFHIVTRYLDCDHRSVTLSVSRISLSSIRWGTAPTELSNLSRSRTILGRRSHRTPQEIGETIHAANPVELGGH